MEVRYSRSEGKWPLIYPGRIDSNELPPSRSWYWLYAPIIGDFLGGFIGAAIYDIFLFKDKSNVVNKL
jgi:hypothetical protein